MSNKFHKVIGIDLGTTYSAVAVYNDFSGEVEIIRDSKGNSTIPSVVSFLKEKNGIVVGDEAKRNLEVDPQNTVIEIKREMGEDFTKESLEKIKSLHSNEIIERIKAVYRKENQYRNSDPEIFKENRPYRTIINGQSFLPQEISAFTLMRMKEIAEKEISEKIIDAVITVPAYFKEKQKKATEEAALLAGLNPLKLIPEPTAAAICYGVDKNVDTKSRYLVYDLGGGTFDVSIIEVEGTNISVIATWGDPRLGGSDFDDAITDWVVKTLKENNNVDLTTRGDFQLIRAKIKNKAEVAKKYISDVLSATIHLKDLVVPNLPEFIEIKRDIFEKLIDHYLKRSLNCVEKAIEIAETQKDVKKEEISAILLVGGSSKIPKVKTMLLDYFKKDDTFIRSDLNPDAVVARGAAMLAHKYLPSEPPFDIKKKRESAITNPDMDEDLGINLITEHSLGVGVYPDLVDRIIEQGSGIPCEQKKGGYKNAGPSDYVSVQVFQGEGKYQMENTLIGTLNIPTEPKEPGYHNFEVTFNLDESGLLSMKVLHTNENKEYPATFEQAACLSNDIDGLSSSYFKLQKMYLPELEDETGFVPLPDSDSGTEDKTANDEMEETIVEEITDIEEITEIEELTEVDTVVDEVAEQKKEQQTGQTENLQTGLTEPVGDIPEQFKLIVRRAKKQYLTRPDKELQNAYNTFIEALNSGMKEVELEDIGDELANLYDLAIKKSDDGLMESSVEIPDQFKMLIRRIKKHYLTQPDPELLNAHNEFIKAMNSASPTDVLEELGDSLADVFDKVRS